ncbi:MAG: terminase family protein [Negativicutes bacterium]|nr:terminase family protein [Negativicutes bacterium]
MALSNAPIQLTKYQQRWVEDEARFKIALKARQTGFSFTVALEVVFDAMEHRCLWVLLSRGERQSKELIEKVTQHARAIGVAAEELETTFEAGDTEYKQLEVRFPNGSRIIGLPANPDTARGFSGNVVLDEFAFHRDSRKIWTALYPTITRGYKIRVISTPNGKTGKFYELWSAKDSRWSKHETDIYTAKAEGMDVDIDDLRSGCESEDDWQQEYCCQFIDSAGSLLTYDMIDDCEDKKATIILPEDFYPEGNLYLGMDIGRKRDLTVIWLDEQLGDVFWTRAVKVIEKAPFRIQRQELYWFLALPNLRRACIDSTGIGAQLAEEAVERYGSKVEAVPFTEASKQEMALHQKQVFEDKVARIPIDRVIREDLHSIKKLTTAAGNVRYDADRNENGHADRFWACALAKHAAQTNFAGPVEYKSISHRHFRKKGAY